ncbi:MAG: glucuronate isomerase, partial [Acidimicrobiales bacterium]
MPSSSRLELNPDRLLPGDPQQRRIARQLYEAVKELPVISPHGHVDPRILAEDVPFRDPAGLVISPDHYVTRLLHADGVSLHDLGVGRQALSEDEARRAWRHLCEHWKVFAGTPVRFWLEAELVEIFGVTLRPSAQTADTIFDQVTDCLGQNAYKPRALYDRFKVEVLTTTFDPCDDLSVYDMLVNDPTWAGRAIPAFRPDRYLELARPDWPKLVEHLGEAAGVDTGDYRGFLEALEHRRRFFVNHGATSADHSHFDARTDPLEAAEAERIYRAALAGTVNSDEAVAF